MSNAGGVVLGALMVVIGFVASYINSYLIMVHINATQTMWTLWIGSILLIFVGMIMAKVAE
jgi:hypothetical protein